MKNISFLVLFVLSIIGIFLLEDGMIKSFSLDRFLSPFIFVSLPFLLAYFLGWKRGLVISIGVSFLTLVYIWFLIQGKGEGWGIIYATFFASFSVLYLIIATIVDVIKNKRSSSQ